MTDNLLERQDLYNEALVRELIEKTKTGAIVWAHTGGTQFHATEEEDSPCTSPVTPTIIWDFYLTKSQIGNLSYKYTLDVKKNNLNVITIVDGPLPYTARDSVSKDLYEIVEILVLELDKKLTEVIRYVQNL